MANRRFTDFPLINSTEAVDTVLVAQDGAVKQAPLSALKTNEGALGELTQGLSEATTQLDTLDSVRTARTSGAFDRATEPYAGGVVTFFDDDGSIQFLNNHVPLYKARGLTATFAIVASRAITPIGITTSGDPYEAMSMEQCRQLAREGFDPQSHTWSHARNVFNQGYNSQATDEMIDEEYRLADEALRKNGLDYNCMTFPWGAYQPRHLLLARKYAKFGVNCRGMNGLNYADTDPMDLNRLMALNSNSNLPEMKAAIDTAIETGAWLILLTHANSAQPGVQYLAELLDYAIASGIRIETFTNAARLKAPAYYAGQGDTAFRVMPDGKTGATLTDDSIARLIARAYELGYISTGANSVSSISAVWNGGDVIEGDVISPEQITVTATMSDETTRVVTDFVILESDLEIAQGENVFTIRYGTVTTTLTLTSVAGLSYTTLGTCVTVAASDYTRDRFWFTRHMDAGTYQLKITLSEPMGASTSGVEGLILKTAGAYYDTNGEVLFSQNQAQLQDKTVLRATFTLAQATDGFFLYAKLLKAGITVTIDVTGTVTDSNMPLIGFSDQPANVTATVGAITQSLTAIAVTGDESAITYQWYENDTNSITGGTAIVGATGSVMALPASLAAGTYYYYCVATSQTLGSVTSSVATVTVEAAAPVINYLASYSLIGAANADVPTSIEDLSGNGNTMTVTGIGARDDSGRLMLDEAGDMLTLSNIDLGDVTDYKMHMRFAGKLNAQNRQLCLGTNDIHFQIAGTSSGYIQIESSAASPGFVSPIQTVLFSPAVYRTSILVLDLDITVTGDTLLCEAIAMTGSGTSTLSDTLTITGFTAALTTGTVYIGNRADGARPIGMALTEFWIEDKSE